MSELLLPRPLLLDSGHLVNMVHRRTGRGMRRGVPSAWGPAYDEIERRFGLGELIALFYEPLSYEWIQGNSIDRALEIASVLDSAICVRQVLPDQLLLQVEAMNAARSVDPQLQYPGFEIIRNLGPNSEIVEWFTRAFAEVAAHPQTVSVAVMAERTEPSVAAIIRGIRPIIEGGHNLWLEALAGERVALAKTRETQRRLGRKGPCPEEFKRYWLHTALHLGETLQRSGAKLDVNQIIEQLDLGQCPAIRLKLDAYWQYARANAVPRENDTVDLALLAPIPYAAFALIQKRLAEFVRQADHAALAGRVFHDPTEFVRELDSGMA